MKKFSKITLLMVLLFSLFVLSGCAENTALRRLELRLNESRQIASNVDVASTDDLSENNLVKLSNSLDDEEQIVTLSTVEEKTIRELLLEIKGKHLTLQTARETLRTDVATLKANVKTFRENNETLTEEEKDLILGYVEEIKQINAELKETIGDVYYKMYQLRGKYTYENREMIRTTFIEVSATMDIRINGINRLNTIINEVNQIIIG